jgi:TatD DNase family protein
VIDTHAHLDALEDAPAAIARAAEAGVTRIVTIGAGLDSCRRAVAFAEAHDGVYASVGIDPHQARTEEAERVEELRELIAHPKVVAVGEAGLDYFHGGDRREEQQQLFEAQLELAAEAGKPIVVHTRAASHDTVALLERHLGTVVMHCFSEPDLLPEALALGWYVSFSGNVTYPKSVALREAAAAVRADRLLVETDSPYLAPQPFRGRTNEPAYVVHTVATLAEARGVSVAALGAQIDANASAAFSLP